MRRTLVYSSQQPTDTLWLNAERNTMIALGYLAQGTFGTDTVVDGLAITPTSPASLAVQIGAGAIYQQESVDQTDYGSLPLDNVNLIIKQGILFGSTSLTLTPPPTTGDAINYLIQAELLESDGASAVLSYFNSSNPSVPWMGPNGSGVAQPTIRDCTVQLQAKAGVAATAGSQTTPAPDAGYVGLYVITVANGATALTSGQISVYAQAPFISVKLPGVPSYIQSGSWHWVTDSGSANNVVFTMNPTPASLKAGMEVFVKKMATPNSGAMTVTADGGSSIALLNADGSAMSNGEASGNFLMHLLFDGTSWRFMNGTVSTSVGSLSATSGEGINVDGTGVVSLNIPSLTAQPAVANSDLFAFYSQGDSHHRSLSWAQFLAVLPSIPAMATLADHLAGTSVTKTANPGGVQAMIDQLAKGITSNGYMTLPGGIIVQWGFVSPMAGVGGTKAITFPIAFPTACWAVVPAMETDGRLLAGAFIQVSGRSKTGASVVQQPSVNAGGAFVVQGVMGYTWIAIGN